MNERIRFYVTAIVGASIASAVAVRVTAGAGDLATTAAASFFALLALLAHLMRYEGARSGATGSVIFLPILASVVVAPIAATPVLTGIAVAIAEFAAGRPRVRVAFNAAQYMLATSAAVLATLSFAPIVGDALTIRAALGLFLGAAVFHGINTSSVAGAISIDTGKRIGEVWIRGAMRTLPYDVLALPVVYLLAWGYDRHGVTLVILFVVPVFGLRQLYKQNWELERANEELLQIMVTAIEARDPYTSGHSQRVSSYSVRIGRTMKLSTRDLEQLRIAALLHDVGKIYEEFAPVLRKAGRLTDAERRLMETHPVRSAELAANVSRLKTIVPALRSHHERWDGAGYPDRLIGVSIPRLARIIAVADTVDAMTSSRPYRASVGISEVRVEIERGRASQFDPTICDSILAPGAWESFAQTVENSRPEPAGGLVERVPSRPEPHRASPLRALSRA